MKLRTKHIPDIGFFAQVKFFFSNWQTIGKHPNGYGLYPTNDIDYPLQNRHEATERCKLFEQWYAKTKQIPTYTNI